MFRGRDDSGTESDGRMLGRRPFVAGVASSALSLGLGADRTAWAQDEDAPSTGRVSAVVSSHGLATDAGVEILNAGGTAADAAIAVAAALTVVEPFFSSALGGGLWALYYDAEAGEVTSVDGVGPVGRLATLEDYRQRVAQAGMH